MDGLICFKKFSVSSTADTGSNCGIDKGVQGDESYSDKLDSETHLNIIKAILILLNLVMTVAMNVLKALCSNVYCEVLA